MTRSDTANANGETLLHQMVKIIVREVSPEAIILFGSRTRGDSHPDSDVDADCRNRAVFSTTQPPEEAVRLYIALKELDVSKNILLYSREEFDHWKNSKSHIVGRAVREGEVLYGRL